MNDVDDPEYHKRRGYELDKLGKFDEALREWDRAIQLDPDNPEYHYNKGNVLADLGKNDEAVKEYDAAIILAPKNPTYRAALKELKISEQDLTEERRRAELERECEIVTQAIKTALHNMDHRYCELSKIDYGRIESPEPVMRVKYLERPFAYEFYHQFRTLVESGEIDLGGPIVQAEVDKDYQHIFQSGKVPDFIIHVPNARNKNLAIIEFKLASRNIEDIQDDLKKLELFRKPPLRYAYAALVLIGRKGELERARKDLKPVVQTLTETVDVIGFNTQSWRAG